MHWTYFALIAVCAFAYWQRTPAISRVATVFLANSALWTLWALAVDPAIDPRLLLLLDTVSALVIMKDPAKPEHGWFGLLFGLRIGSSLAFIYEGAPVAAAQNYWGVMNFAAQLMMIFLFLWSEANGGQISRFIGRAFGALSGGVARHFANRSGAS